jgi:proline iminopeptidase
MPSKMEDLLFPLPTPYRQAFLPVTGGHRMYFEESGDPGGLPVVCLHGGPGSGSNPTMRRFFPPGRFRVILYDQRGTGRSEPRGQLEGNTTPALVEDLERLRRHLGVERWIVFGGSWGATLALRYAQAHPENVMGLVLRGPLLGRQCDLDWFFGPNGVARIYPQDYGAFLQVLPEELRASPIEGYQLLLQSPEPAQQGAAALAWSAWDHRVATGRPPEAEREGDISRSAIACHYAVNQFFLPPEGVLADAHKLAGIPGWLVQGQLELVCPMEGATTLADRWPNVELRAVPDAGHLATDPAIARALLTAVQESAERFG